MTAAHCIRGLADIREIESRPYEHFMPHSSVLGALEHATSLHPERTALLWLDSADPLAPTSSWSYQRLLEDVRKAARAFAQLVGPDTPRVAFLLPAIPQAYVTIWAAEATGVACPINYLLDEEHIAELVEAAGVNILVALGPHPDVDIWSRVAGLKARCAGLRHVVAVGKAEGALDFDELLASQDADRLVEYRCRRGNDLAALFHTGGTTGRPKLAQQTQANQLHAAWGAACMFGASEEDVILNGFPLFHVAGSFVYGLSILLCGGQVVLPTALGMRNQAFVRNYWKHVERHRVTLLAGVPTIISALLNTPRESEDVSSVRCLLTGGSPLPPELAQAFEQRMGIGVRNILGMTECSGVIAIEPIRAERVPGSAGFALPFTSVWAVGDSGRALTPGEDGIVCVRGPNVGPGYTDVANNEGIFLVDGQLVTGDLGHVDADGRVHVTGREKDLIIRSSHNIDPLVIEDVLMRHPDVSLAAAIGAPDEYAGEVPVAYVLLRPGSQSSEKDILAFAEAHIPERPALPKAVFIIGEMPMTAIGKVFKPSLRAAAIQWVVQARLRERGLSGVSVCVVSERKHLVICFGAGVCASASPAIRELMAPFALQYRINENSEEAV